MKIYHILTISCKLFFKFSIPTNSSDSIKILSKISTQILDDFIHAKCPTVKQRECKRNISTRFPFQSSPISRNVSSRAISFPDPDNGGLIAESIIIADLFSIPPLLH